MFKSRFVNPKVFEKRVGEGGALKEASHYHKLYFL